MNRSCLWISAIVSSTLVVISGCEAAGGGEGLVDISGEALAAEAHR